ncbi:MAG TPA: glycosyltransferase family 4 protein [Blastocatellia bacterium]|nr:glycosyltransferase family 4 protein [Blastocatellia bacterium]
MFRLVIFIFSFVVSWLVTRWLVRARWQKLDLPNARSSHSQPTPRMGGIGIVAAFGLTVPLLWVMVYPGRNEMLALRLGLALAGFMVIAAVGLVDDLRSISPLVKYLGQLGAAALALWSGVRLGEIALPFGVKLSLGIAGALITIIWLTGFSNIFNFMDGIDGLAGGIGAIYSLALAVVSFGTGHRVIGAGCLILAAGCLGFLAHNFPPARIFMGDVGSLFVGYVLAALAAVVSGSGESQVPLPAVLLICGTFLYDGTFTLCRRLLRGEKVWLPHRSHLYQRLIIAGQSHRRVTLTYYFISLVLASAGIAYTFSGDLARLLILAFGGTMLAAFTVYVYRIEAAAGSAARKYAAEAVEQM